MTSAQIFDLLTERGALKRTPGKQAQEDQTQRAQAQKDHAQGDHAQEADSWELRLLKATQYPSINRRLAYEIVKHFVDMDIQVVIGTNMASLHFSCEIARQLDARSLYAFPKTGTDAVELLEDFRLHSGDRVLLVTDVLRAEVQAYKRLASLILDLDARLIGIAAGLDLSGVLNLLNVRQVSILTSRNLST